MDDESTQLDVCDAEIFFLLRFRLLLHVGHVFSRAVTDTEHQSQITFFCSCNLLSWNWNWIFCLQMFVRSSQVFKNIFQWLCLCSYSVNKRISSVMSMSEFLYSLISPADDTEGRKVQLLLNTTSTIISIIRDINSFLFCFICNHLLVCHYSQHVEVSVDLNDIKSSHRSQTLILTETNWRWNIRNLHEETEEDSDW